MAEGGSGDWGEGGGVFGCLRGRIVGCGVVEIENRRKDCGWGSETALSSLSS